MRLRIRGETLAFARDRGGRQPYEAIAHSSQQVNQLGGIGLTGEGLQGEETGAAADVSVAEQVQARVDMEAGLRQTGLF